MNPWYDKQGNSIDVLKVAELKKQEDYWRIAEDVIGKHWISTVWLGIDHSFEGKKPVIFETMVFESGEKDNCGNPKDYLTQRYYTEEEAKQGHADIVKIIKKLKGDKLP